MLTHSKRVQQVLKVLNTLKVKIVNLACQNIYDRILKICLLRDIHLIQLVQLSQVGIIHFSK
ncbi:hypothetical protein DD605_06360 [Enterobacter cloacae complex sp. 3DZ3S2B]|nr:hypothetical protein DD603_13040 [Enterobacter cloacae complex sp. 2DZ2F2B]RYA45725.1 hypothetical protein DD605_06360 [Enterobacter cloacae complex sp. 3DZ3S2B]